MNGFLISAPSSGSGKTLITIGIIRAFKNMGLQTACFKAGPDYIDPQFHAIASGCPSFNIDSYLFDDEVEYLFNKHSDPGKISVVEGVMGLFDGAGFTIEGSSAFLAKKLGLPVVLVVNGKGASLSLSALIKGFKEYDKDVKIAGFILNNVNPSPFYRELIKKIEDDNNIKCFGTLPLMKDFNLKERHLGLYQPNEIDDIETKIDMVATQIEATIDILSLSKLSFEEKLHQTNKNYNFNKHKLKIAIAYDNAFSFYYKDNLLLMEENNIELVPFSPLADKKLPLHIDGVYLGGGYPELYCKELSKNTLLLEEIKTKLSNGLGCYAECGGLMYLTNTILPDDSGLGYPMTGFFDCDSKMTDRLQKFGYVTVNFKDVTCKAHMFHYSELINIKENDFTYEYLVSRKDETWQCGLRKSNTLSSYAHIHFYSNVKFLEKLIKLYRGEI